PVFATPAPSLWAATPPRRWGTTAPVPTMCCPPRPPPAFRLPWGCTISRSARRSSTVRPKGRATSAGWLRYWRAGSPLPPTPVPPNTVSRTDLAMTNPYWSDLVRRLAPYIPGEQPSGRELVKLNTNENPFGPSPRVLEAIAACAGDNLRLYPPPESDQLRAAIAGYHGVAVEQVFVGNGSDEVLAHSFQAFFTGREQELLFPDISYSFYPVYCGLY